MIGFDILGRDEGLNLIRLESGEAHRLTDAQFEAFQATGELPAVDPIPEIVKGPGVHPWTVDQPGGTESVEPSAEQIPFDPQSLKLTESATADAPDTAKETVDQAAESEAPAKDDETK